MLRSLKSPRSGRRTNSRSKTPQTQIVQSTFFRGRLFFFGLRSPAGNFFDFAISFSPLTSLHLPLIRWWLVSVAQNRQKSRLIWRWPAIKPIVSLQKSKNCSSVFLARICFLSGVVVCCETALFIAPPRTFFAALCTTCVWRERKGS